MIEGQAIAAVAKAFKLDGEFESAVRYGSGHIHDTFSVRCDGSGRNGTHILLQCINTKIFKNPAAVMENIRRGTTHVRSRLDGMEDAHRRVLQLVETCDGKAWHIDEEGRYWRAYVFIE